MTQLDNIVILVQQRAYIQTAENNIGDCIMTAVRGHRRVFY